MLIVIALYFAVLLVISRLAGRNDNDTFFRGGRRSPWGLVAFGMIGGSISGVTFVSVPGMVMGIDMTYMQMCIGFFFGYLIVAFLLLPLYYRHNLTSIYSYLNTRFGTRSHKTGAAFFILSKLTGAAVKLYLVCLLLQRYVFDSLGIPYFLTVTGILLIIWLYTHRSGIRALLWTDALQTLCLILALILIIYKAATMLDMNFIEAMTAVWHNPHSRMFEFSDFVSTQNFWKQFLSGIFIVIVMTGLDQDNMQKNLTCKNLRSAQKDMCTYGIMFIPLNFLFLSLGVLLTMLYASTDTPLPAGGDSLLPDFIAGGQMGQTVLTLFTLGIIASAFSGADSAITSLTTTFCVDILEKEKNERIRKRVHIGMTIAFALLLFAFKAIESGSIIDTLYTLASYTYGPLLGLFAFGIFTKRQPNDRLTPFIAIASPILCYAIDSLTLHLTSYKFGYELLMLNGLLTFAGLYLASGTYKIVQARQDKLEMT